MEDKKEQSPSAANTQPPQQLNIASTDETIAPADETSAILPPKSDIQDMEVHHHSHASHGKKNWKSYFWEFLMLFLAVFCGFLAEYQLEHVIEHNREKQYMQSLLSDLTADITMLDKGIERKDGRINAIDSVFNYFELNQNVQKISGKFLKTLRRTTFDQRLIRNNITINQLKNAGGMRLIRNKQVADSISVYDLKCEIFDQYNEQYITNQNLNFRYLEKIVIASDLSYWYKQNKTEGVVGNIPDSINIRVDLSELNQYINLLNQVKTFARQEITRFKQLRESALSLIMLIKKEYHFD